MQNKTIKKCHHFVLFLTLSPSAFLEKVSSVVADFRFDASIAGARFDSMLNTIIRVLFVE